MIHELPKDALAGVFTYLNAVESIACRGVCQLWSKAAGHGTMIVRVRNPPNFNFRDVMAANNIGCITLSGRAQKNCEEKPAATEAAAAPIRRTRGHLPKPVMLTQDINSSTPSKITFATDRLRDSEYHKPRTEALEAGNVLSLRTHRGHSFKFCGAIQMENVLSSPIITLDLSSSSSHFEYSWRSKAPNNGPTFDEILISKKARTLRSYLEELDVSGLQHLKELSVRGCGNLRSLNLSPSLRSLDAGGCSELIRVDFPNGADGSLQSLDLSGCRMLREHEYRTYRPRPGLLGPHTAEALRNVVNLDMSQVLQHDALDEAFCNALRLTISVEMFSLRYAANDEVLKALAESESARNGTLRLVDIAFSAKVTDESVELLAKSAQMLERLNMRGCKKIAARCYNYIPVYLERRRRREEDGSVLEEDESFRTCSRKGDNLFYFSQKK